MQLGWEKEFGLECPVGDDECQRAVFFSQVDIFNGIDSQPVWTTINQIEAFSFGGPRDNPGYRARINSTFQFSGTVGQTGIDLNTPIPNFIDLDLSDIAAGRLFTVQHTLIVYAFDRALHLGGPARHPPTRQSP